MMRIAHRSIRRLARIVRKAFSALRKLALAPADRVRLSAALNSVKDFPTIHHKKLHGLSGPLIVSLTSYPPRFCALNLTIKSLIDQTIKSDRIILWVSENDIHLLPSNVTDLMDFGLEIKSCVDLGSANKLVHSIAMDYEAHIVTADDDLYYNNEWLEGLVVAAKNYPNTIVGYRAHLAIFDNDGNPRPYQKWEYDTRRSVALERGQTIFLTGVGGILYPPRSLHRDVFKYDLLRSLCPSADDIWFFAMSELNGYQRRRIAGRFVEVSWPGSQETSLKTANVIGLGNDQQIKAIFAHYLELVDRFRRI